jgi:predicted dehydrogenase
MNQTRVGVIGTGTMGQRHCRVYSNMRHVQLVGIFDAHPETGHRIAQQYDTAAYDSIDRLLDDVEAVSLAVPTPLHFDIAMRCLERKVHVLVEKPITETLEQANVLTCAAEASGLVVQVGHIERFNPAYIELKNMLQGMNVIAIDLRRLSAYQGSNTDVDVVLDLMIHDIDLACDLIGQEPPSVDGYGLTAYGGALDHVVAHFDLGAPPLLTMTASRVTEHKIRAITVTAADAFVEADLLNKTILVHRRTIDEYLSQNHRGVKYRQESIVERIYVPSFEPLFLELQHFVDCIREHKVALIPARDGLRALRLATRIRDATAQRRSQGGSKAAQLARIAVESIPACATKSVPGD